jgi:hypothetical protein
MLTKKQRWAEQVVSALIQGQEISRAVVESITPTEEPKPSVLPDIKSFLKPVQYTTVPAGSIGYEVFKEEIPPNYFGIVREVANTYYLNDKLYWVIDTQPVYGQPIERIIGEINSPKKEFRLVYHHVKWSVDNPDVISHDYEILTDGIIAPLAHRDYVIQMVLRGVF